MKEFMAVKKSKTFPGFVIFFSFFKDSALNPFAPEPPVTARADPGPFYPL